MQLNCRDTVYITAPSDVMSHVIQRFLTVLRSYIQLLVIKFTLTTFREIRCCVCKCEHAHIYHLKDAFACVH